MSRDLQKGDLRLIRLNLYATQLIVGVVALAGGLFLHGRTGLLQMFTWPGYEAMGWAALIAVFIAGIGIALERSLPAEWVDDGGINQWLFSRMSLLHIIMICLIVAICEELLFRGVMQPFIGNGWTSLLFTLLHVRYLKKPILVGGVFAISYALGGIQQMTGGLPAPILAHWLIDVLQAIYLKIHMSRKGGPTR